MANGEFPVSLHSPGDKRRQSRGVPLTLAALPADGQKVEEAVVEMSRLYPDTESARYRLPSWDCGSEAAHVLIVQPADTG